MESKYTVEEIATKLKVSKKTILREVKKGKLKTERVGRRHLISEKELGNYLNPGSSDPGKLADDFLKAKKSEMIAFLQRMVSIPSVTNELGTELKLAHLIKHKLNDWGLRSIVHKEGNAVAVHASLGYADEGILLDCPLDTLPAGDLAKWSYPPFEGVIKNGKMYGRGTADSKSGIASMLYTLLMLKTFIDEEKFRVELVFDGGEQDGVFAGMRQILGRGLAVRAGIIGYAGDQNDVLIGARGYHRYLFNIKGQAVHTGSRYKPGVNAISKMAGFIQEIEKIKFPKSKDPLFDFGSRLTFSRIEGGRVINMVPDSCSAKLDVRVTPEINKKLLDRKISNVIGEKKAKDKDFNITTEYLTGQEAYVTKKDEKIVSDITASIKEVIGKDPRLIASGPAHVGNLLNEYGVPMIVWGPKGEKMHSYDEYIEIDSITKTTEIYFRTIMNFFSLTDRDLKPQVGLTLFQT